jgi:hypothetical protein
MEQHWVKNGQVEDIKKFLRSAVRKSTTADAGHLIASGEWDDDHGSNNDDDTPKSATEKMMDTSEQVVEASLFRNSSRGGTLFLYITNHVPLTWFKFKLLRASTKVTGAGGGEAQSAGFKIDFDQSSGVVRGTGTIDSPIRNGTRHLLVKMYLNSEAPSDKVHPLCIGNGAAGSHVGVLDIPVTCDHFVDGLPTPVPTKFPTSRPTRMKLSALQALPTSQPSLAPSAHPSISPSAMPSQEPTIAARVVARRRFHMKIVSTMKQLNSALTKVSNLKAAEHDEKLNGYKREVAMVKTTAGFDQWFAQQASLKPQAKGPKLTYGVQMKSPVCEFDVLIRTTSLGSQLCHSFTWQIDDGPIYPYSPTLTMVTLASGQHTLRLKSGSDGWNGAHWSLITNWHTTVLGPLTVPFGFGSRIVFKLDNERIFRHRAEDKSHISVPLVQVNDPTPSPTSPPTVPTNSPTALPTRTHSTELFVKMDSPACSPASQWDPYADHTHFKVAYPACRNYTWQIDYGPVYGYAPTAWSIRLKSGKHVLRLRSGNERGWNGTQWSLISNYAGNPYTILGPLTVPYGFGSLAVFALDVDHVQKTEQDGSGGNVLVPVVQLNPPSTTPTSVPTNQPTIRPTTVPTHVPTNHPTIPTTAPSYPWGNRRGIKSKYRTKPTSVPTLFPTPWPSYATASPTKFPTHAHIIPTQTPTKSLSPTKVPTKKPVTHDPWSESYRHTFQLPTPYPTPTSYPTSTPTINRTHLGAFVGKYPWIIPVDTVYPTLSPTPEPTLGRTPSPTATPIPTATPSVLPTFTPTTLFPTPFPTPAPNFWNFKLLSTTMTPSYAPSSTPTNSPTSLPTSVPPTGLPTKAGTLSARIFEKALGALDRDSNALKNEERKEQSTQMADLEAMLVVERMKINQGLARQIADDSQEDASSDKQVSQIARDAHNLARKEESNGAAASPTRKPSHRAK